MSSYKKWVDKLQIKQDQKDGQQSTSSGPLTDSTDTGNQEMKALPDLKPLIFLSSIEQIIFNDWIEINTGAADKRLIVVSGEPTEEELELAWLGLQGQYMAMTDKDAAMAYMEEISETERLVMRINDIKFLLYALQLSYEERTVEQLRAWDIMDPLTPESYTKDITRIENRLKSDEMRLMMVKGERSAREKEKEGGEVEAMSRENYLKILLQIGDMRKMHYSPKQINTMEFAIMYSDLREYHNLLKQQNHGN